MIIKDKNFDFKNNVYIMGILNYTPDSFSDGGRFNTIDKALFHTEKMIEAGLDIIDVGGESTRPNHTKISISEEIDRVSSIIDKIKTNFDIPISLDSYKSEVIKANVNNIDMINDIWGLKYDENMAKVVADSALPYCLMHNREKNDYQIFFDDFINDIKASLKIAKENGISDDKIILDGGVGFQKNYNQNLQVINRTDKLVELGYPVMIATSRKSVIGYVLDKDRTDDRLYGTLATTVVGILKGASMVRVHDIKENYEIIKMTKSIIEESKWTK
ncbi:MAG: dihydropteroate synthase [Pleomorphochaeta sp.]